MAFKWNSCYTITAQRKITLRMKKSSFVSLYDHTHTKIAFLDGH